MSVEDIMAAIPKEGFIKIGSVSQARLDGRQRSALIRKGNQLFNERKFDQAKKIFLATGYTDGIIRIGDLCWKAGEPFEALRMYALAPAPRKTEEIYERMSVVLRHWIST